MFNQRKINNSDRPRSNFSYQRAADHPDQPSLVRFGPPAPMKSPQNIAQVQQNTVARPEFSNSGTSPADHGLANEEKKQYNREFLLRFRFSKPSMGKPEGLPFIPGVVLDKPHKPSPGFLNSTWQVNRVPSFLPSFVKLDTQPASDGWRRRTEPPHNKPSKIITNVSLNDEIKLNKAANAWRPGPKKSTGGEEENKADSEAMQTKEMLRCFRSILNKLTPQKFDKLTKQVTELAIDTEERLKGVIDLVFEKAVGEPHFSETYARLCNCLVELKVPTSEDPGVSVDFRSLLLHCCEHEFKKSKLEENVEAKLKELDASTEEKKRQQMKEELEEAKNKARRRSLGNIKFIGELFKLKMLADSIVHQCIAKLLKDNAEESLECLGKLLSTIGKDVDEKAKKHMDYYFSEIEEIILARKTTSRIRFMLQDLLDLRKNKWVPRRPDQGPKTLEQIHKEAKIDGNIQQQKTSTRGTGPINISPFEKANKMETREFRPSTVQPEQVPMPSGTLEEPVTMTEEMPEETPDKKPKETSEEKPEGTSEGMQKEPFLLKERRTYSRGFLQILRLMKPSTQRPEGLPDIPGVVLDKPEKRRTYSPEFMQILRLMKPSTQRPEGLPDIPGVVLNKPEKRRTYSPEFMQILRLMKPSTQTPEGLPDIPGVVLDKPLHEFASAPESAPSALELKEIMETEAEDVLPEETTTPEQNEEEALPAEDMTIMSAEEKTIMPAEEITIMPAAKKTIMPAAKKSIMPAEKTMPAEKKTMPAEEKTTPAEEKTTPAEKKTTPAEKKTTPAEKKTMQAGKKTMPAEKKTMPAEKKTMPAEKKTMPGEKKTMPAEKKTIMPAEEKTIMPAEEKTIMPAEEKTIMPAKEKTIMPAKEKTIMPAEENTIMPAEENTIMPAEEMTLSEEEEATNEETVYSDDLAGAVKQNCINPTPESNTIAPESSGIPKHPLPFRV